MNKAAREKKGQDWCYCRATVGTIGKNENFIWQKLFLEMYLFMNLADNYFLFHFEK